jgi:23S rRNA (guanosine2251-2'-O)-methyltransferase
MARKVLYGFHAIGVRLKVAPQTVRELQYDPARRDQRMRAFVKRAEEAGAKLREVSDKQLHDLARSPQHQGVVALVEEIKHTKSLDDLLDGAEGAPLLLLLDSVTDPHNLGACLRVADGAGAHAIVAPVDHACGINATVAKVSSGASETVPYFMVTNLARTMNELKERGIVLVGTSDQADKSIYDTDLTRPVALVLGAEGEGMRRLTRDTCDELVRIPMQGAVESLNVSVASAVCLYEAVRQRKKLGR